jgi:hypothetical protein
MPALGDDKKRDVLTSSFICVPEPIGRERPVKHQEKPDAATKWENSCMGG